MRNFMLHLRLADGREASVGKVLRGIQARAANDCPDLQWQPPLGFGTGGAVRFFSAPDEATAMRVESLARDAEGVAVEVLPLQEAR